MPEQLRSLPVPWQSSTSTPFMELKVAEYASPMLEFEAFMRTETEDFHCVVKVTLEQGSHIKVHPAIREGYVLDERKYDWSLIPFRIQENFASIDERLSLFNSEWIKTGICPDPRAYEVINSEWKASLPSFESEKLHLIFVGEELSVECLTKGWTSEYVRIADPD